MPTKKINTPPRYLEYMPITDIKPHPNNPKTHDQPGIERSISRYGLAEVPLLDERTGQLVAGHGRLNDLLARHAQGQTPPDGVHVNDTGEWMIPVIRGWASRSDAEADAYLIASNQLTINGGWNEESLNALLGDLAATDYELALTTGYNPDELAALLDTGDDPIDIYPDTQGQYAETPEEEAARAERIDNYAPKTPAGLTEISIVMSLEDREELGQLLATARQTLGDDTPTAQIILTALRNQWASSNGA